MTGQVDESNERVGGWLDWLIAVWIIFAAGVFFVPPQYTSIVTAGRYAYVIMISGCIIGSSLALLRHIRQE